jgi:hypothetical protein
MPEWLAAAYRVVQSVMRWVFCREAVPVPVRVAAPEKKAPAKDNPATAEVLAALPAVEDGWVAMVSREGREIRGLHQEQVVVPAPRQRVRSGEREEVQAPFAVVAMWAEIAVRIPLHPNRAGCGCRTPDNKRF